MRALAVAVLACIPALAAPATAGAAVSCHEIMAHGVGQEAAPFTTTAVISGGGLLHGTTEATFAPTGFVFPVVSFTGTITFTVNKATLTAGLDGTLNILTGEFAATTTSISGTGKLAGATGSLSFAGVQDLTTGTFTETVSGEICADLAP